MFEGFSVGQDDDDDGLHAGVIAAIVIAVVALLLIVAVVALWYVKVYPNTKTNGQYAWCVCAVSYTHLRAHET